MIVSPSKLGVVPSIQLSKIFGTPIDWLDLRLVLSLITHP